MRMLAGRPGYWPAEGPMFGSVPSAASRPPAIQAQPAESELSTTPPVGLLTPYLTKDGRLLGSSAGFFLPAEWPEPPQQNQSYGRSSTPMPGGLSGYLPAANEPASTYSSPSAPSPPSTDPFPGDGHATGPAGLLTPYFTHDGRFITPFPVFLGSEFSGQGIPAPPFAPWQDPLVSNGSTSSSAAMTGSSGPWSSTATGVLAPPTSHDPIASPSALRGPEKDRPFASVPRSLLSGVPIVESAEFSGGTTLSPELLAPVPLGTDASGALWPDPFDWPLSESEDAVPWSDVRGPTSAADQPDVAVNPTTVPAGATSGRNGEQPSLGLLHRTGRRIGETFSDAYASPLGPGAEYRALVAPFVKPSGTWTDSFTAPFRTFNEALLLGVPEALDAVRRLPAAGYNALVDAGEEAATSLGMERGSAERLGRDIRAMPEAIAAAAGVLRPRGLRGPAPASNLNLTGQLHHAISSRVHKALQEHQNLKDLYVHRDRRFETRARDRASHLGWWGWHSQLDEEVANHIRDRPDMTQHDFERYLRDRYAKPDLKQRFPKGL
jgi:hypothetical protein